jgi:hypothetical protein
MQPLLLLLPMLLLPPRAMQPLLLLLPMLLLPPRAVACCQFCANLWLQCASAR